MPGLTVLCGGGGVGKTSTSAALGAALARSGQRTLVVTIDPARRLADALGIRIGDEICPVSLPDVPKDKLFVRMPQAGTLANDFVDWLFEEEVVRARIRENRAFHELADAIVGTTELFAISLIERDLQSGVFDHVVLDTAPSRHALYFLTYPKQLLDLLDAKALKWIADLAVAPADKPRSRGLFSWGREKVEALFSRAIGHDAVVAIAGLLGEVVHVRKRWSGIIRAGYERLLKGGTRFVLVGAPTGAALDDVEYLLDRLRTLGPQPAAVVLNRAESPLPATLDTVRAQLSAHELRGSLLPELDRLTIELDRRARAADAAEARLRAGLGHDVPLLRLPMVAAREPVDVVLSLAAHLGPLLQAVV